MSLFKITEKEAHFKCHCGEVVVAKVKELLLGPGSISYPECKCKRVCGSILAGEVPVDSNNYKGHELNQTLGKRLFKAGQFLEVEGSEKCDKSLMEIGKDWKKGIEMNLGD